MPIPLLSSVTEVNQSIFQFETSPVLSRSGEIISHISPSQFIRFSTILAFPHQYGVVNS